MSDGTDRTVPGESSGGEFRVGSDAPVQPVGKCGARWEGEWEDRAEARPECEREKGHADLHHAEITRLDGRCWRYSWGAGEEAVERC